ncbi:MAG: hypothetical protein VW943_01365 [Flavobacteriaceae bacterium]
MKYFGTFLLYFTLGGLSAQGETEVYLLDLTKDLDSPINISQNPGYDNQPSFWDNDHLLYTRTRAGQTDIVRYNLNSKKTEWLCDTPQGSEYSPLRIPDSEAFSAIRLDTTGFQRLYRYTEDGKSELLFSPLKIGYHHWVSDNTLLCTVLVEDYMNLMLVQPNSSAKLITEKVGRSLHRIPKSSQLSFIQQKEGRSILSSIDLTTQNIQTLLPLPEGVQDVAWLASGTLIFAQGNTLFQWDPNTSTGIQVWKKLSGINSISRLALSPNGKLLALVGNE